MEIGDRREHRCPESLARKELVFLFLLLVGFVRSPRRGRAFRFLPTLQLHRFFGCSGLGLLLTAAAAFPENNPLPNRLHHKSLVVLGATLREDLVNRTPRR